MALVVDSATPEMAGISIPKLQVVFGIRDEGNGQFVIYARAGNRDIEVPFSDAASFAQALEIAGSTLPA
ncbi:hypothetical protein [Burkholderia sp. IDO3]|uniref:hypothetical protein n=1 Tax=Burkholderia sp. IDO3 TaxID=1705310 RepID=UPI00117811C1|nr:hypothetical protein [Burkholderia sp. IDO3]